MKFKTEHDKYKKFRENGHDSMSSMKYAKTRGGKLFQAMQEPMMR